MSIDPIANLLLFKGHNRPLVIVESPYAASTHFSVEENLTYARKCIRDCISRGESPIASHLLYTQPHILDDQIPEERALGIACGYSWMFAAAHIAVYIDHGLSLGMQMAIDAAEVLGIEVVTRRLPRYDPRAGEVLNPAPDEA